MVQNDSTRLRKQSLLAFWYTNVLLSISFSRSTGLFLEVLHCIDASSLFLSLLSLSLFDLFLSLGVRDSPYVLWLAWPSNRKNPIWTPTENWYEIFKFTTSIIHLIRTARISFSSFESDFFFSLFFLSFLVIRERSNGIGPIKAHFRSNMYDCGVNFL